MKDPWFGVLQEVKLLNLLSTKHPKSEESWSHRRWLLHFTEKLNIDKQLFKKLCKLDMTVCERCAKLYPRNYFAWAYRRLVITSLKSDKEFIYEELENMKKYAKKHVSDHSGFSYVQFLFEELYRNFGVTKEFLEKLIDQFYFDQFLIINYPGHEALWAYRRFLWDLLLKVASENDANIEINVSVDEYKGDDVEETCKISI